MQNNSQPIVYAEDMAEDAEAMKRAFAQTRVPNELIILPSGDSVRSFFNDVLTRRQDVPALALIDLSLPYFSGLEAIRWIRDQAPLKIIPVVALARVYNFDELEKSYDFGANLYILKPREVRQWADLVFRLQGYWSTHSEAPLPQIL